MGGQNWLEVNGVKVNYDVFFQLEDEGLVIEKRVEDEYPWVFYRPSLCDSCRVSFCGCPRPLKKLIALHHFVWDFYNGRSNPRREHEVIHHQGVESTDEAMNKMDARIKNLGKGTPSTHAKAHNERKRKRGHRERTDFGGFRFRPHLPARVVARPELIGIKVPPRKRTTTVSLAQRLFRVEHALAALFDSLWATMSHLDSGVAIPRGAPRSAWKEGKTRSLGLKMPRLGCTRAEVAFVLLCIRHRFEIEAVAEAVGEPAELLRTFLNRPSISESLRRWQKFRRLPLAAE